MDSRYTAVISVLLRPELDPIEIKLSGTKCIVRYKKINIDFSKYIAPVFSVTNAIKVYQYDGELISLWSYHIKNDKTKIIYTPNSVLHGASRERRTELSFYLYSECIVGIRDAISSLLRWTHNIKTNVRRRSTDKLVFSNVAFIDKNINTGNTYFYNGILPIEIRHECNEVLHTSGLVIKCNENDIDYNFITNTIISSFKTRTFMNHISKQIYDDMRQYIVNRLDQQESKFEAACLFKQLADTFTIFKGETIECRFGTIDYNYSIPKQPCAGIKLTSFVSGERIPTNRSITNNTNYIFVFNDSEYAKERAGHIAETEYRNTVLVTANGHGRDEVEQLVGINFDKNTSDIDYIPGNDKYRVLTLDCYGRSKVEERSINIYEDRYIYITKKEDGLYINNHMVYCHNVLDILKRFVQISPSFPIVVVKNHQKNIIRKLKNWMSIEQWLRYILKESKKQEIGKLYNAIDWVVQHNDIIDLLLYYRPHEDKYSDFYTWLNDIHDKTEHYFNYYQLITDIHSYGFNITYPPFNHKYKDMFHSVFNKNHILEHMSAQPYKDEILSILESVIC